MNSNTFKARVS